MRAVLRHTAIVPIDRTGNQNIYPGVSAAVHEEDGTTPFAQTMYDAPVGGNVITSPLTANNSGFIEAYAEYAQPVVLVINGSSFKTAFVHDLRYAVETYSAKRPWVNPRDLGARANGVFDDGPYIQEAVDVLTAAGGGTLYLNAGDWYVNTADNGTSGIVLGSDNITIRGDGTGATRISTGPNLDGGALFYALGKSGLTVRDMRINVDHSDDDGTFGLAWAVAFYAADGEDMTDLLAENLDIRCVANANGVGFLNNFEGNAVHRQVFRRITAIQAAGSTESTDAIAFASTADVGTPCYGLVIEDVHTERFSYGIAHRGSGVMVGARLNGFSIRSTTQNAIRFYHCGGASIANGVVDGGAFGIYLDEDAANFGSVMTNVQVLNCTTLGMYTEEMQSASITNCRFEGNQYGLWLPNARNAVLSNCVFRDNDKNGLLVDVNAALGSVTLNAFTVENVVLNDCVVAENGEHGVYIRGVRRSFNINGGTFTRNGLSSGAAAASSTFADIAFANATTSGEGLYLIIKGATLGNVSDGSSSLTNGKSQYGILQVGGTWTGVEVHDCTFIDLETPLSISNGSPFIKGNVIRNGNSLTLPSTTRWRDNDIQGGTLAETGVNMTSAKDWDRHGVPKLTLSDLSTKTFGMVQTEVLSLASGAGSKLQCVQSTSGKTTPQGMLFILDITSAKSAIYGLKGTNGSEILSTNTTDWATTSTNLKTAVYYDAGPYMVENRTGSTTTYICWFMGNSAFGGSFS